MKNMNHVLKAFLTTSTLGLGFFLTQSKEAVAQETGPVIPDLNDNNALISITSIQHGVSNGYETLIIEGTPFNLTIRNESNSALAARLMATCYKNAQVAMSIGTLTVSFAVLSDSISATSSGITGSASASSLSFVLKNTFPGTDVDLQCALGSSGPSL